MNFRNVAFSAGFLGATLLAGCSSEDGPVVDSQQLALTAQQNTEQALRGLYGAGSFLADSASLAELLGSLGSDSACDSAAEAPPCLDTDPSCVPVEPEPCTPEEITTADLQESRADVEEAIDEVVNTLRERVFTPQNLESEDETSATYLLGADELCDDSDPAPVAPVDGSSDPAAPLAEEEESCEDMAARLQLRLRLSSPAEGDVDVDILLGAARHNPVTIQLYDDRVGVVLDLGELYAAVQDLGEEVEGISSMSGQVGFEVVKLAELDYSFRINVLQAVHVSAVDDENQTIDIDLAASSPTMELRLDGNLRRIVGTLAYGALRVAGPLNAFRGSFGEDDGDVIAPAPGVAVEPEPPPVPYTGNLELLLGGVNGSVTFDGTEDALNLDDIGLGDQSTTLKHDGNLLLQLDVNQAQGRRFDLGLQSDGAGSTTVTFSPTLDVSLMVAFASLASQIPDLPAYLMGDTLRFWFDGENPSLRTRGEQLEVVSGTFHMSSATNPATNVDVPAGSCFADSGVEPVSSLIESLSVQACQ